MESRFSLRERELKMKKLNVPLILLFLIFFGPQSEVESAEPAVPQDSLFLLPSHWKNQDGVSVGLRDFSRGPVILSMTYTGCQYSCPLTLNKLIQIEKDLQNRKVDNYRIVVASFDAERDKPEVLKAYMAKRKLDPSHWTFLSAPSDRDVRELAVVLHVNYQKIDGGDFSHSNVISLLDSQGRLILQLNGLASDHAGLVDKVTKMAAKYDKKN